MSSSGHAEMQRMGAQDKQTVSHFIACNEQGAGSFNAAVYACCTALGFGKRKMRNRLKFYRMGCSLKEVQAPLGLYEMHIGVNQSIHQSIHIFCL